MTERIVASWSGGIDSTAVIANLLRRGWDVTAVTLNFSGSAFNSRELAARSALLPHLVALPGTLATVEDDGEWLWSFSPDGVEIPTRNKRIIDHIVAAHCIPAGIRNIGMGEYVGCDTWVVRDHVGAADCDARSLTSYLYEQYGLEWRLVTLADFGESRYKADRLRLLVDAIGISAAALTTNCLRDSVAHCGTCYKCVERAAAFDANDLLDKTVYAEDPYDSPAYETYRRQMRGAVTPLPAESFPE